jgi:polar amino acid transport system ATP-binding protein
MTLVNIRGVHKYFGDNHVLRGIDLTVERGQVVCIVGPSGSGKSTLLRCINHLETVDAGRIEVAGKLVGYTDMGNYLLEKTEKDVAKSRASIGMVFQNFNLFGHLTAVENVARAPIKVKGMPKATARRRAGELLAEVGLSHRKDAYPSQLSGGQQQRVAIARALAMDPLLMLFDEPTSALDPELVGEVLNTMRALAASGTTMIVVTHEIGFAKEVADTVVFMDEGLVMEMGPSRQVIDTPHHPRTVQFLRHLH